jgi:hypothetical protein
MYKSCARRLVQHGTLHQFSVLIIVGVYFVEEIPLQLGARY